MTGLNVAEIPDKDQSVEDAMSFAFPDVEPGLAPYGSRVLVQIRTPKTVTEGGIHIPEEARETEKWNTQVAKVIAIGPVAFKNRETLKSWARRGLVSGRHFCTLPEVWWRPLGSSCA